MAKAIISTIFVSSVPIGGNSVARLSNEVSSVGVVVRLDTKP
jgi:hypothetical protein